MTNSEWQDERPPEKILNDSAVKTRYKTPWDMLNRPEKESVGFKNQKWYLFFIDKRKQVRHLIQKHLIQKYVTQYIEPLFDAYVGLQEKKRRLKGLSASSRALKETLNYYTGLYQNKSPNPVLFFRFLKRNGVPDWNNPYPETTSEYYHLHPLGFIAADVDYLLQALEQDWENQETQSTPSKHHFSMEAMADVLEVMVEKNDFMGKWPSLYDSELEHEQNFLTIQADWRNNARQCWALMLIFAYQQEEEYRKVYPKSKNYSAFHRLKKEIHPDNLWLITVDAYQNYPESLFGFSKEYFQKVAQSLGFGMGLDFGNIFSVHSKH